ncbi:hypothetical protein tpqmel_0298 [Candidatus Gastranaerophilus sp. (ex Termes propinquus)]|nr:hypothetical protein tpqmel_0298 [Candidatus Gastranaerophilus sp. (ex Termes propinquus)]
MKIVAYSRAKFGNANQEVQKYNNRQKDSTYHLFKNPEIADSAWNKNVAVVFNLAHPNWQDNKKIVSHLKQDTIGARAAGKFKPSWHEVGAAEWLYIPAGLACATSASALFLKKQIDFKSLTKPRKAAFALAIPLGLYLATDSTSYIFTGKRLGELARDTFSKKDKSAK